MNQNLNAKNAFIGGVANVYAQLVQGARAIVSGPQLAFA